MTTTTDDDNFVSETWVYKGPCTLKNKKVGQLWHATTAGTGVLTAEMVFQNLVAHPFIGCIYNIKVYRKDGGALSAKSEGTSAGLYRDRDKVVEWKAAAEAWETVRTVEKQGPAFSRDEMRAALSPIANAMAATNARGRRAIKVLVLEYLDNVR